MKEIILEVNNLSKKFENQDRNILENVSFKINSGDFVSILGASGSGKSTLLTICGGMDIPSKGEIIFNGVDITKLKEKDLAVLRRTKIGFVFQFFNLAPYLNAEENIVLPMILDAKSSKGYNNDLEYLLDYLKLQDLRKKMPSQLSGGEQQRIAIARGLIYKPKIIYLDEPTGNLDSKIAKEIMELLVRINIEFGTTIMQVTHSEYNASYGNKIIRINDGKIIEEVVIRNIESEPIIVNENNVNSENILMDIENQIVDNKPDENQMVDNNPNENQNSEVEEDK
ncbi:MAG: ABC transporter ATP-binding protein [Clostridia bacterium]